ncbi:MAG: tRNA (N(6)-L-threonylcarbamoyladenosine(37)-C(2))-methylthiotransferase MtaB [Opitutales bacterium]
MNNNIQNRKKASVHALGCRLNQYEAVEMEGRLKSSGYDIVSFGEEADLGVINTCTVTNEADSKSRNVIRRFIRKNPQALTVVVGCYSQVNANRIAMIDGVDYIIGNHDKMNFLNYLGDEKPEVPVIIRERISREDFSIGFVGEPKFEQRANLKIQDGCDFMCSFCIIPFSRGRARSREINDLLDEANRMITNGVREIILTGVNLGTYHSGGVNFLGLIEKLASLEGLDRIRISSIEPTTIPTELFQWMADDQHPLTPYLHIPLQAGCNSVLKNMKRRYGIEEMLDFFNSAKMEIPKLCIGTDLMVGFPGESEKDFLETSNFFTHSPLSYCHVFTFSERSGTPASKMKNQVPMDLRRKRSAQLRRLSSSKRMDFHKGQEGNLETVLIENPKDNYFTGYTPNYTRVIVENADHDISNQLVQVRLNHASPEFIDAELILE